MNAAGQIVCLKCGYDLQGLSVSGICPECAHPVLTSLHVLPQRERRFLKQVAWGATTIATGQMVIAAGFPLGLVLQSVGVLTVTVFAGGLAWPIGWLLVSARPPERLRHQRNPARWVVRALSCMQLGAMVVSGRDLLAMVTGMSSWRGPASWTLTAMAVLLVSTYALWIAGFFYLEEVARVSLRCPSAADRCGFGALVLGALLLVGLLLFIVGGFVVVPIVFFVGAGFVWKVRTASRELLRAGVLL